MAIYNRVPKPATGCHFPNCLRCGDRNSDPNLQNTYLDTGSEPKSIAEIRSCKSNNLYMQGLGPIFEREMAMILE